MFPIDEKQIFVPAFRQRNAGGPVAGSVGAFELHAADPPVVEAADQLDAVRARGVQFKMHIDQLRSSGRRSRGSWKVKHEQHGQKGRCCTERQTRSGQAAGENPPRSGGQPTHDAVRKVRRCRNPALAQKFLNV